MTLVSRTGSPLTSDLKVDIYPDGSVALNDVLYSAPTDIAAFIRSTFGPVLVQMISQDTGMDLPKVVPHTWRVANTDKENHVVTFVAERIKR
jgi:hypothetical protein